jgi:hypothetical protein
MAKIDSLSFDDLPTVPGGMPQAPGKRGHVKDLSFEDIPSRPLSAMEGAGAFASGFNRSALAGIPGMPVKTALDVADLARAGYGFVGHKLGMLSADEMPQPLDRSHYMGSPEWIADKIGSTNVGRAAINNPRPDDPAARVLNAGGSGVAAGLSARPADAAMQFASGAAGQIALENGASPEWAMVASMSPQIAATGGQAAVRGAVRGGEAGRREMAERLEHFDRAGVKPTAGLASGRRWVQAFESALAKTPGGAGRMAEHIEGMHNQMGASAAGARDRISPTHGPVVAGDAIKAGVTGYRQRQQDIYRSMQDRAEAMIPEGMRFPVAGTMARGDQTLADIQGAPNVSRSLNQPLGLTREVLGALEKDAAPRGPTQVPSSILREDGSPFQTEIPRNPGGLPFEGIKGLRERIGQSAYADNPLLADANSAALKHLYRGAREDVRNAGVLADQQRIAQGQSPGVARQLDRADRFYSQTQTILEKSLAPLYKAGDPAAEKAFYRVESSLRSGGHEITKDMARLPMKARRTTAATLVDRIGRASPGQQDAEGSAFSAQTFLTNWNKIAPDAKNAIFLGMPERASVKGKLDSLAQVASYMRDGNKVFANPSGTAGAAAALGTAATTGAGLMGMATGNPAGKYALALTVLTTGGAKLSAHAMTNPKFVNWLAATEHLKPQQMGAHLRRLNLMATNEKDEALAAELTQFAQAVEAELFNAQ